MEEIIYHGVFKLLKEKCGKNKFGQFMNLYQCPHCKQSKAYVKCRIKNLKSCGCVHGAMVSLGKTKHGMSHTRLHKCWIGMRDRVSAKWATDDRKKCYKDKGIIVCQEWMSFIPFMEWALNNGYSDNLIIDRKDGNGNYCPENCKWVTHAENTRNSTVCKLDVDKVKDIKKKLSLGGKNIDLAKFYNVDRHTILAIKTGRTWRDV